MKRDNREVLRQGDPGGFNERAWNAANKENDDYYCSEHDVSHDGHCEQCEMEKVDYILDEEKHHGPRREDL
jgi:hypothetical protein